MILLFSPKLCMEVFVYSLNSTTTRCAISMEPNSRNPQWTKGGYTSRFEMRSFSFENLVKFVVGWLLFTGQLRQCQELKNGPMRIMQSPWGCPCPLGCIVPLGLQRHMGVSCGTLTANVIPQECQL